jgi:hypothetical protein
MTRQIPITKGYVVLVDDEDYTWLSEWKWKALVNVRKNVTHVYAVRHETKGGVTRPILMHRVIANAPRGTQVDHINFNGLDNRRLNLRICTHSQNSTHKRFNSNAFGLKGIQYKGGPRPWVGVVTKDRRVYRTEYYVTALEAAAAYDRLAVELHGEFAVTNSSHKKNCPIEMTESNRASVAGSVPA